MTIQYFKPNSLVIAINIVLFTSMTAYAEDMANTDNSADMAEEYLPHTTLPTITVTASSESADGPVQGIAASTTSAITGFGESILKSPQTVNVVGRQEIESIGANNMDEALGYVSNVTNFAPDVRIVSDFQIRGFDNNANSYRDGQRYHIDYFDGPEEIYGLERIEVIKGPNSVLNGTMPPGGTVNTTTKKPYFSNGYEVNAEVGSFNHKQVSTDINQKISDDVAVRLVGVYKNSDTYVDFIHDNKTYIAPSLTWQPSSDTSLTLQADYQHIDTIFVPPFRFAGTLDTENGKIERGTFAGVPGFDQYDSKRYSFGYDVSHSLTPNLQINHKLRRTKYNTDDNSEFLDGLDEKQGIYTRDATISKKAGNITTGTLSAQYDWSLGDDITNASLFGVDYTDLSLKTDEYEGKATNINLFNPNHSESKVGDKFTKTAGTSGKQLQQTGIFAQNQLTYNDNIVALFGLRHDRAKYEVTWAYAPDDTSYADQSATTGRVGLVYLMDNGVAPYASYSQSFEPQAGKDRKGNEFEPTRGAQYEVGVRYQPEGQDTLLTASLFRINKTNETVTDPIDNDFEIQNGETRAQGVELEAKTKIGDNAHLIAAYGYNDARVIKASPVYPEEEGKRVATIPYNTFALWSDYRFANYGMPKLKVGAGVQYKDSLIRYDEEGDVPGYALVNAMASYDWSDNLKLSLNVNNLLDNDALDCYYWCSYVEPRNIVGKVTYKW